MGAARQAASRGEREWRGGATSIPGCEMLFRVDEVWGLVWGGAHCQPSVRSDDQVVGHGTGLGREGERRRQRGVGWLRAPPCGAVTARRSGGWDRLAWRGGLVPRVARAVPAALPPATRCTRLAVEWAVEGLRHRRGGSHHASPRLFMGTAKPAPGCSSLYSLTSTSSRHVHSAPPVACP